MSDTPRTEAAKFSGIHAHTSEHYVDADFARELERENTHLLVLATNAEFDRSKLERELAKVKAENARLREAIARAERNLRRAIRTDILGDSFACGVADDPASALPNAQAQR